MVDDSQGALSAMAMIWLYDLVIYRAAVVAPHPFGEFVHRRLTPPRS